jgi:hypothetical protein
VAVVDGGWGDEEAGGGVGRAEAISVGFDVPAGNALPCGAVDDVRVGAAGDEGGTTEFGFADTEGNVGIADETGLEVGLVPTGVSGLGGEVEGAIEWRLSRLDAEVGFEVDDGRAGFTLVGVVGDVFKPDGDWVVSCGLAVVDGGWGDDEAGGGVGRAEAISVGFTVPAGNALPCGAVDGARVGAAGGEGGTTEFGFADTEGDVGIADETGLKVGLVLTAVSGLGGEVEGANEWLPRLDGGGGGGPCAVVGFDVDDG